MASWKNLVVDCGDTYYIANGFRYCPSHFGRVCKSRTRIMAYVPSSPKKQTDANGESGSPDARNRWRISISPTESEK